MRFLVGTESGDENRSVAWVLGYPGCFTYGVDPETALAGVPNALREYNSWIAWHNNGTSWVDLRDVEVCPSETWQAYAIDENYDLYENGYMVNAWFRHDWKPLNGEDVEHGLKLLAWSENDLEGITGKLDRQVLDYRFSNERWTIDGILRHISGAEWWYLDRLGLAMPRDKLPEGAWERLYAVRSLLVEKLSMLVDSKQVVGVDGEFWSPRKLLRRAVWHQRDHTEHIRKLLKRFKNEES
jgi:hypothetical protein